MERKKLKLLKRLSEQDPMDCRIKSKLTKRIKYLFVVIEVHGGQSIYVVMKQVEQEFDEYLEALEGVKTTAVVHNLGTV